jgi:hypothetical protein
MSRLWYQVSRNIDPPEAPRLCAAWPALFTIGVDVDGGREARHHLCLSTLAPVFRQAGDHGFGVLRGGPLDGIDEWVGRGAGRGGR